MTPYVDDIRCFDNLSGESQFTQEHGELYKFRTNCMAFPWISHPLHTRLTYMVLEFYVSLLPVILAGIATMVWIKAPILAFLESPLDLGKELKDGERLFGDHKTFKGLVGYVGFAAISTAAWGLICSTSDRLTGLNLLYVRFDNTLGYNLAIGALLGLTWALFELPNSFMKRRLKIEPGKPAVGVQKVLFTLVDQSDSIFGCVLVLFMTCPLTIAEYFIFVAIGTATHLVINVLLWLARLRKEPF